MRVLAAAPGFEFPPVNHLFDFAPLTTIQAGPLALPVTWLTVVMFAATLFITVLGVSALRRPALVPTGLQNFVELQVNYVRTNIANAVLGHDGDKYLPLLCTFFFWTFSLNIMSLIPFVQIPVTSHMAFPVLLTAISYLTFNVVGIKEHGLFKYFKLNLFPSGVPKGIYVILTPIELLSTFIFRPITLAVRLFANMMAGHVILAIFYLGAYYFIFTADSVLLKVFSPLPVLFSIVLMMLEAFVAYIQAFMITILTAVYIAGAVSHDH